MGKYDQLDANMVDRQKTECNSRRRDIKLEISCEWIECHRGRCWRPILFFDISKWFGWCCSWPPSVSRENRLCAHTVSARVAAAPGVIVQSDPWATYSVTVAAIEGLRTWPIGCFCHLHCGLRLVFSCLLGWRCLSSCLVCRRLWTEGQAFMWVWCRWQTPHTECP